MNYFELPKLPKIANIEAGDRLELWLAAFCAKTEEQLSKIKILGGTVMEQLVDAYHSVVALPEFREMMRQRERARHNEAAALANAARKGRQEGRQEQLRKNVQQLCQAGFTVAQIAKGFKLSEDEVKTILGL